jgi:hypothetical protein
MTIFDWDIRDNVKKCFNPPWSPLPRSFLNRKDKQKSRSFESKTMIIINRAESSGEIISHLVLSRESERKENKMTRLGISTVHVCSYGVRSRNKLCMPDEGSGHYPQTILQLHNTYLHYIRTSPSLRGEIPFERTRFPHTSRRRTESFQPF